ncbi:MAG: DUF2339 domain-containing protein [Desulfobulbaceae bacterium]|nr:DUF2339 domain-containing protein [Desulfobulbaceae bacterium]
MIENKELGNGNHFNQEVARLSARIDDLAMRLAALESLQNISTIPHGDDHLHHPDHAVHIPIPEEKGIWTWIGINSVLPRIAAICFMLVVALLLRTVTDNGWVGPQLGTVLGVGYVAILLFFGWRQYAANCSLAPVFSGCSLLLLFSIIAESRFHFSVLPIWLGSSLLIAAAAAAMTIAIRYRAPFLLWLAVMGATLVVLVLDFPNITFPTAAGILLLALFSARRATNLGLTKGLRWVVLLTIFFLFFIWETKLSHAIKHTAIISATSSLPPTVFAAWYLPALLCFSLLLPVITSRRLFSETALDFFEHMLPLAGASLFILGGNVVLVTWWGERLLMGISTCVFGFSLLGVIWYRLSRMNKQGKQKEVSGIASFGMAAAMLFFAAILFLADTLPRAQMFLPFVFIAFLALSHRSGSGNMRLLAVVLALVTMMTGIHTVVFMAQSAIGTITWLNLLTSSIAGMGAFFWCRLNPPPQNGFYFHVDNGDYTALVFLAYGLLAVYSFAAIVLTGFNENLRLEPANLACGRSILINIGAAILITWGTKIHKSKEISATGIVVALIGGAKVFFSDLFHAHGLPLVLSVSSFGALTAFCSLVLGNWQKMCGQGGQSLETEKNPT